MNSETVRKEPRWLNRRALTLLRLWRTEEAFEAWEHIIESFPSFEWAYFDQAHAAQEVGLWAKAARLWAELRDRFPDREHPEWLANQARCLINHSIDPTTADLVIADLETRFPDSPLGRIVLIERAEKLKLSADMTVALVEESVRRFPADRVLLAYFVRILLAQGRRTEAAAVANAMAADVNDHVALVSQLRVARDQDGDDAIEDELHSAVTTHRWSFEAALSIGYFLLEIWTTWATELALILLGNITERFPGRAFDVAARAQTLIMLRRDDQALALIDSVPALYRTQPILELKAWAAARRGEIVSSRQFWRTILSTYYFPAIYAAEPTLELVSRGRSALKVGDVTAFVAVRNELQNVAEFLAHHRRIGINNFVIVDNMSTDGVDAYLREEPDVTLYRTRDIFAPAGSGMRWINTLIERHGAGGWCVYADADEALIYPGWETTPIQRLIAYLDFVGAEGMAAYMLDVYPERLISADGRAATHSDCRYYDNDYRWVGHARLPYLRPLGGVLSRLFRAQEYLHKVPLIKSSCGVHIGPHETTPLRLAEVSGALLHYKMLALAMHQRQSDATEHKWFSVRNRIFDVMHRYERYASRLAALEDMDLRAPGVSQLLTGSLSLVDRGLMRAPPEFWRPLET